MNFYISIITHPVTYGFFTKRKVDELVSICIVTETGVQYRAVNKRAAKWKGIDQEKVAALPHEGSYLWKDERNIASEISTFIRQHSQNGVDNILWGYQPAKDDVLLDYIKYAPGPMIHSLYQEAYNFVMQNEEYIRSSDRFTVQPLDFGKKELERILQGHKGCPKIRYAFDSKENANRYREFHSFLEKIKGEMILSSIPESNN